VGFVPNQSDYAASGMHERKEVLSIFRELWSMGNSPLHRMYSSWEELESNIDVKSDEVSKMEKKSKIRPCPYCGAKQAITKPLDGIFPYSNCKSCKRPFYIQNDFSVRKLTEEEKVETPDAWIRIVEDLTRKKAAVILKLE
jgi:hypothetical protein